MSGLYNLLFGVNPFAFRLVRALGLMPDDFGRFRDAFRAEGGIVVYTRCGGGNRQDYGPVFARMREHSLYLRDADDGFDNTYCTFFFRMPELPGVDFTDYLGADIGLWNPDKRWADMQAWLQKADPETDPKMAAIVERARPVFKPLTDLAEQAAAEGRKLEITTVPLGRDPKKLFD